MRVPDSLKRSEEDKLSIDRKSDLPEGRPFR